MSSIAMIEAAFGLLLLLTTLAAIRQRMRKPAAPVWTPSRSSPLFDVEDGGTRDGSRYEVRRSYVLNERSERTNEARETIAIPCARGLRFVIGPDYVPDTVSAEVHDPGFDVVLRELRNDTPDFVSLEVLDAEGAQIPVARKLAKLGDVIVLTRAGGKVPYRDQDDIQADIDRLARLRDILASRT